MVLANKRRFKFINNVGKQNPALPACVMVTRSKSQSRKSHVVGIVIPDNTGPVTATHSYTPGRFGGTKKSPNPIYYRDGDVVTLPRAVHRGSRSKYNGDGTRKNRLGSFWGKK